MASTAQIHPVHHPRMVRVAWLLILALLASTLAVLGASPARASLTASISGTVTTAGPTALSGATVQAFNGNGSFAGQATTNGSGNYTISGLAAGTYTLLFSPPFATNLQREYYLNSPNRALSSEIVVADGAAITGRNALLDVGATITGNVKGAPTTNLFDVSVTAYRADGTYGGQAYTDASGNFSIQGLPTGSYTLFYDAPSALNYVDEWWNDRSKQSIADYFSVTAPATVTGKNAVLAVGAQISGNVKGFPTTNLENVGVTLYDAAGNQAGQATTDLSGNYIIGGVAPGNYTLKFASNLNYRQEWWNNKLTFAAADLFAVTTGTFSGKNAVLDVGSTISGNVQGPGSVNLENAVVVACSAVDVCDRAASTDVFGNYTINGLYSGSYRLKFSAAGYGKEWYSDQLSYAAAAPVAVVTAVTGKNEVLGGTCSLSNAIYDSYGVGIRAQVADTWFTAPYVSIYDASTGTADQGSLVYKGFVDGLVTQGSYTVPGLAAGTYKMQFTMESSGTGVPSPDPASVFVSQWYNAAYTVGNATPFTVTPPGCSGLSTLSGNLYDPFFADAADPSTPFFVYINWMGTNDISTGTPQPSGRPLYVPLNPVSRQAMATFLFRLSNDSFSPPNIGHFADVPTSSPNFAAIEWMYSRGISTGTPQPTGLPLYKPTDPVSRQAMATFLTRYQGVTLSPPSTQRFADVPIGATTAAAIDWMYVNGISTGTPQPSGLPLYKPTDSVSRQAMAAFLYRVSLLP